MTLTYNVLDLFCGCGGMSKGLQDAGMNIVAGIDIWDKAIDNYSKNNKHMADKHMANKHMAICADLTKLTPEIFEKKYNTDGVKIDVITGGPPCQGFSMAGSRKTNDPRNSLFMEFVKYVDYYKPKAFVMENVMGILSMKTEKGEKAIDIIMSKFTDNYNCVICKLYASDFNVPQNRRRVIILGFRKDLKIIPTEPKPILKVKERIPIKTILLPRNDIEEKYYLTQKAIDGINRRKEKLIEDGKGFGAQIVDMNKPSYTISARYYKDGYDCLIQYEDKKIRRLTITELKRIQTFPDNYILEGSNKEVIMQIGNAVACTFAKHIGEYVIKLLKS